MSQYRKFGVALGGFFTLLGGSLGDGAISMEEGFALLASLVTAGGVFLVSNKQPASTESEPLSIIQNLK